MRLKFLKVFFVILALSFFLPDFQENAQAGYIKRVSVEPFQNPPGWKNESDPGALISEWIMNWLDASGRFQVVSLSNFSPLHTKIVAKKVKAKKISETKKYPGQVLIKGRVLKFPEGRIILRDAPGTASTRSVLTWPEIDIEINLVDTHTGNIIQTKWLRSSASDLSKHVILPKSLERLRSRAGEYNSLGKTLTHLSAQSFFFIDQTLSMIPFEFDVVAVDKEEEMVLLNIGKKNGIEIGEVFDVFSPGVDLKDPMSGEDLGNRYTRIGVIKIHTVQEKQSEAQILVGADMDEGLLVRSKIPLALPMERPWWDFYGWRAFP